MKKLFPCIAFATCAMFYTTSVFAQSAVTTTQTTTSNGTVTQIEPNTLVIHSSTQTAPLHYTYSKSTTYVDQNGNPVSMETVKSGLPVTVYYTREGGQMIANKVVVRKTTATTSADGSTTVEKQTSTRTSSGDVASMQGDTLEIKSSTESTPMHYTYTKSTTYVDSNGNPVSMSTVRSGAPVKVYYTQEGDQMIATKVVVTKTALPEPVAPATNVIEKKTSTTTTTNDQ